MGLRAQQAVRLWVGLEAGQPCNPVAWGKTP